MSGLYARRRRWCSSLRPQASAPRMRRGRLDWTPRDLDLGGRSHSLGTSENGVIAQWAAVVRDPHRPLHPFFDHDVGRPDIGPHLIAVSVVGPRPGTTHAPCGCEAQAPVEIAARRTGAMQIGGPGWLNGEAPMVDRQIALQKRIGRVRRRDIREPQLLEHPILSRSWCRIIRRSMARWCKPMPRTSALCRWTYF
jgi:hypothetical protein